MTAKKPKRSNGDGSLYRRGNSKVWWMGYRMPDGTRKLESAKTERRPVAMRLLQKRVGARLHNLPIIPNAEQVTFHDAVKMLTDRYAANHASERDDKKSRKVHRRVRLHLIPYFGGRRLAGITTADVRAYVAQRLTETIVTRKARTVTLADGSTQTIEELRKPVAAATINRELAALKRVFNLAIQSGKVATKPHIELLKEAPARSGFLERDQHECVVRHLPADLQPIVRFAYLTGWRVASEVLPLEWRQVDFEAGEVRLFAGTTKNGEGRVFPFTSELRAVLAAQHAEHERLKKAGHIVPYVFWRMVAKGRGGEKKPRRITSLNKAWKAACRAAGCPGRIPHDMRRSAVRIRSDPTRTTTKPRTEIARLMKLNPRQHQPSSRQHHRRPTALSVAVGRASAALTRSTRRFITPTRTSSPSVMRKQPRSCCTSLGVVPVVKRSSHVRTRQH